MQQLLDGLRAGLTGAEAGDLARLGGQAAAYFVCGRSVSALAGWIRPAMRGRVSPFAAAQIPMGALALHGLAFVVAFGGLSLRAAHGVAFGLWVVVGVLRRRDWLAFDRRWALLMLVLAGIAFIPAGAGLTHATAQSWDEFTHWAARARELYLIDRLPGPEDPVSCVAPFYGLYSTLIAVLSYVLLGRESVGAGTCWSLLFAILLALHVYEVLRSCGVAALIAGPAATWLLASLCNAQPLLTATMYADGYVMVGGALAAIHSTAWVMRTSRHADPEHGLLAATGMCILLFTKTTGEVIASCVALYVGLLLLIVRRRMGVRSWVSGAAGLASLLLPAALLRGGWWFYTRSRLPDESELLRQQGMNLAANLKHYPWAPLEMSDQIWEGLWPQQPYHWLIVTSIAAIVVHLALRVGRAAIGRQKALLALAGLPILVVLAYVPVFTLTFGPERARIDIHRYAAVILPVMLCYAAGVLQCALTWEPRAAEERPARSTG